MFTKHFFECRYRQDKFVAGAVTNANYTDLVNTLFSVTGADEYTLTRTYDVGLTSVLAQVCFCRDGICWDHFGAPKSTLDFGTGMGYPGLEYDMPVGKSNSLGYSVTAAQDHNNFWFGSCAPTEGVLFAAETTIPAIFEYTKPDFNWAAGDGNSLLGEFACGNDAPVEQSFTLHVCGDSIRFYMGYAGEDPLVLTNDFVSVKTLDDMTPATSGYVYLQTEGNGTYAVDNIEIAEIADSATCRFYSL